MVREYNIIRDSKETNQLMYDNSKVLEIIFESFKIGNKHFTLEHAHSMFMSMEHDDYQPSKE